MVRIDRSLLAPSLRRIEVIWLSRPSHEYAVVVNVGETEEYMKWSLRATHFADTGAAAGCALGAATAASADTTRPTIAMNMRSRVRMCIPPCGHGDYEP